ncbi:MAG: CHAT domain-containing protein [Bacteroidales bacterium]
MKHLLVLFILPLFSLPFFIGCKPTGNDNAKLIQNQAVHLASIIDKAKLFAYANQPDSAIACLNAECANLLRNHNYIQAFNILHEKAAIFHTWQQMDSVEAIINITEILLKNHFPDDKLALSTLFYTKGRLKLFAFRLREADSLMQLSLSLRTAVNGTEDTLLGPILNELGSVNYYYGRLDSAKTYYSKALQSGLHRKNQLDRELVRYYHNNGFIIKSLGDFSEAKNYYQKGLNILLKMMDPGNPDFMQMYRNLAFLATNTGQLEEGMELVMKAEENAARNFGKNSLQYASILELKAQINYQQKNFEQARTNYESALDFFLTKPEECRRDINYTLTGLGNLEMEEGNYGKARSYFSEAAESNLKYFPQEAGNALMSVAYSYELDGMLEKARQKYLHSLKIIEQYFGPEYYMLGLGHQMLATLEAKLGDYGASVNSFNKAIEIYRMSFGEKSNNLAESYMQFGLMYLKNGNPDAGMKYLQRAEIALIPSFNDTIYAVLPHDSLLDPEDQIVRLLQDKAEGFIALAEISRDSLRILDHLKNGLIHLQKGIRLMEMQRNTILTEGDQLIFQERINLLCRQASDLCYRIYSISHEPVFAVQSNDFTARRKMMVLRSLVNDAAAKKSGGVPDELLLAEKNIRKEITNCQALLTRNLKAPTSTEQQVKEWRRKLYSLFDQLDSLGTIYNHSYPEYYKLKFDLSTGFPLNMKPGKGETVIEYDLDSTRILAFVASEKGDTLISQKIDSTFFVILNEFLQQLSLPGDPDMLQAEMEAYRRNGTFLYSMLLKPFITRIGTSRLTIIPDGILGLIPFEALPAEEISDKITDFSQIPYLVKKVSVRYAYSSAMIQSRKHRRILSGNNVLAMAPGYEPGTIPALHDNQGLAPLPNSLKEIKDVTQIMGGKTFSGENATAENFFSNASGYPVIHLSMHTLSDRQDPMNSRLLFYPGTLSASVSTSDLYMLQLNSPLVVLSACNTGSGKIVHSEGLINIARGFLYAGAESMVLTLWDVSDYSSSRLVSAFYSSLASSKPKDIALRDAKITREFMSDPVKAHPYYWAGYILVGDAAPLKPYPWRLTLILISFTGMMGLFIALRIRRKKKNLQYPAV